MKIKTEILSLAAAPMQAIRRQKFQRLFNAIATDGQNGQNHDKNHIKNNGTPTLYSINNLMYLRRRKNSIGLSPEDAACRDDALTGTAYGAYDRKNETIQLCIRPWSMEHRKTVNKLFQEMSFGLEEKNKHKAIRVPSRKGVLTFEIRLS